MEKVVNIIIIEVKNSSKNYKYKVKESKTVAFIRPNGAGKSTIIKMITGIIYFTNGESISSFDKVLYIKSYETLIFSSLAKKSLK